MSISNRPIKFRLFEPHGGEWESPQFATGGNYMVLSLDGKILTWDQRKEIETDANGGKLVLQQFTGKLDKNDTEIYEGDILATANDGSDGADVWEREVMGVVEWDKENAMFRGLPDTGSDSIYSTQYVEVIGNVLENPELIPNNR